MAEFIFVPTNDRENPNVRLTIMVRVAQQVEVIPSKFQLSPNKDNAGMPDITLKSRDGRPFSIKGYVSSDKVVSLDFDPDTSASEFILKPTVDMRKLRQHRQGMIKIDLTHPRCSSVVIFYKVVPKFQAEPAQNSALSATSAVNNIPSTLRNLSNLRQPVKSVAKSS